MKWMQAQRAEKMNPSVIRKILKATEKPGIISFAGGLPSPKTFPVDAFAAVCAAVLKTESRALKIGEPSPPPSPGGRGRKITDASPVGVI